MHVGWLPPAAISERPMSQMQVSRLAGQAVDENKSADSPAYRFDGEIARSILVHHGQMRREARLRPVSQTGLRHRLAQSFAECHETVEAVATCQHKRSLPMTSGKACHTIELDLERGHRNGAGCPHCGIDDSRRTRAGKTTGRQQRDMEALRRDRRCRKPQASTYIARDPNCARRHRRVRQDREEHVVQRRIPAQKTKLLSHQLAPPPTQPARYQRASTIKSADTLAQPRSPARVSMNPPLVSICGPNRMLTPLLS